MSRVPAQGPVIPAKAGIQGFWVPAFAGTSELISFNRPRLGNVAFPASNEYIDP